MVTAERFAQGMTFDQYVAYAGSASNLKREGTGGTARKDWSGFLRQAYDTAHLSEAQQQAWSWLASQRGGPAKMLVISEEWSSDCRRDVPMVARVAAVAGLELRIFSRDGDRFSAAAAPNAKESPNADLVAQFLKRRDGQSFQSIPVIVFYTRDMQPLYQYVEFPGCYRKDNLLAVIRGARAGESAEQTKARADREFVEMLGSPFFYVWQCAAVDEMASMLYERLRVGSLA